MSLGWMKQQLVLGFRVRGIAQAGEILPLGGRREGAEGQDFSGVHPLSSPRCFGEVLALHERPRAESDRRFGEESSRMQYFSG